MKKSGVLRNQSQHKNSNLAKEDQLMLDPLKFLELKKDEILFKFMEEMGYSEKNAISKYDFMTEMIVRLKPLRTSESQTIDYVQETIKKLPCNSRLFMVNLVLMSLILHDSYCHAYNSIAHFANHDEVNPFTNKYIPEPKILALIEGEKMPLARYYPQPEIFSTNPLVFDETLLNGFYLAFDHFIWEHTSHVSFMNWFRVNPTGKPIFKDKMMAYFCYAVGKIENRMIEAFKPKNLNRWIEPLISVNNYSMMKKRVADKYKIAEIDNKLSLF
jgi:hypothetical protein